jgi:DNA-binding SARP family transcriptional activator/tetratricopeptide (TPR) repeat protein
VVEVQLLGPLVVRVDGALVAIRGAKERAVLSLLALRAGSVVSTGELVDALWGSSPPTSALRGLHNYVANLRRVLPAGVVATVTGGYRADLGSEDVDALCFERAVAAARGAADGTTSMGLLEEALAWWRGPPLADLAASSVGVAEITRLAELRAVAEEELFEARLAGGEHTSVVADLEAAVATEPLRERRWAQLMLALYRSGRQGDALRAFQRLRAQVGEQLGIEPSAALRTLEEAILLQKPELDWQALSDDSRIGSTTLKGADSDRAPVDRVEASVPLPLGRAAWRTLIGRRAELDRIGRLLGGGRQATAVVVIAGEAGVGKTRLAADVAQRAVDRGALVLYGRCDEGLRVPYQPFVEALGSYARSTSRELLARQLESTGHELGRLLPDLAGLMSGVGPPVSAEPETERWRLFQATAEFLRALAAEWTVVVIVDDLQWAEPATLLLARHLARAAIDGVLIVATARMAERSEPDAFAEALADLAGQHLLDIVTLDGLTHGEVAALVADRLGCEAAPDFVDTVCAQTGGNPFYVHELISHLADLGLLDGPKGDWPTPSEVEQSGAPQGVRHVLSRRIRQLSPSARDTLIVAAVAGAQFWVSDLRAAPGGDVDQTLMALEEAAASGLVVEIESRLGLYRFAHALVRRTLYETVSALRRAQLHWRVADAIRASDGHSRERLSELAYHYRQGFEAGDPPLALDYVHQAADQAFAQLAFEQAVELYEAGLSIIDRCPEDLARCYHLVAGLAESAAAVSDHDTAHRAWLQAADLAERGGDAEQFCRAVFGYDTPISTLGTEDETIRQLCDRGLRLTGNGDSAERARLLALAAAYFENRDPHQQEQLRDALAMTRRIGDERAEARVLACLNATLRGTSRAEELLDIARRALAMGRKNGYEFSEGFLQRDVALAATQLGKGPVTASALSRGETLARAENYRPLLHDIMLFKAAGMIARGQFAEAKKLAHDVRDIGDPRNVAVALGYGAQMWAIRAEQGQAARVLDYAYLIDQGGFATAAWQTMLAALRADLGQSGDAAERLDRLAANNFAAIPRDWTFPLAVRYLPETCALLGDRSRAAQLLPEVEAYRGQLLVVVTGTTIEGAADRSLGQIYALLDRFEQADSHFEAAHHLETSMGFAALAARTRYWHGRLVEHAPNRLRRQRLAEAQHVAAELGMFQLQRQAKAWLDTVP